MALKSCLHGSKKKIYENYYKIGVPGGPSTMTEVAAKDIYDRIKTRLMKFTEGVLERQLRLRREWDALTKTKQMTAGQFESSWEELLSQMDEVGLAKTGREQFLAYIEKVGPQLGEEIRRDRRPRPDGAGGEETRAANTWEEAHLNVVELEQLKGGTKALLSGHRSGGQNQWGGKDDAWCHHQGWQEAGKKGKGKKGESKGKSKGKGEKGPCFEERDNGKCTKPNCPYKHQGRPPNTAAPQEIHKTKKQLAAEKAAQQEAGGQKGGGKGGGKGKGKSKGKGADDKSMILCKYTRNKNLGKCPDFKNCPYNHSIKKWEAKTGKTAKIIQKKAGAQDAGQAGDGWDQPVGLKCGGHFAVVIGAMARPVAPALTMRRHGESGAVMRSQFSSCPGNCKQSAMLHSLGPEATVPGGLVDTAEGRAGWHSRVGPESRGSRRLREPEGQAQRAELSTPSR